jgi:hypothetical protein
MLAMVLTRDIRHYRNPPTTRCRIARKLSHPALVETTAQTLQDKAAKPALLWLPSSLSGPLAADAMVWEVDESHVSESQALVTPKWEYD